MKYNCLAKMEWVDGTLRKESVERHLVSGMHKIAVDREREALKAKVHGGVKRYLSKGFEANREAIKEGIQIVYYIQACRV